MDFDDTAPDADSTATNSSSDAAAEIAIVGREWVLSEWPNEQ